MKQTGIMKKRKDKLDILIDVIAEQRNEKIMTAFLDWQDEQRIRKEILIKKLQEISKK